MLAARGSGSNSVVLASLVSRHCLWPRLPSANMSVLKFSYHWYGWNFTHYIWPAGFFEDLGKFSPRLCGTLNTHVLYYLHLYVHASLFTSFFSQRYIIFCKHKGGKVVDEVTKFPFHNWNIVTNFWMNFHPPHTAKILMPHWVQIIHRIKDRHRGKECVCASHPQNKGQTQRKRV